MTGGPQIFAAPARSARAGYLADWREWDGLRDNNLASTAPETGWAPLGAALLAAGQVTWWNASFAAGGGGLNQGYIDALGPAHYLTSNAVGQTGRIAGAWSMPWWLDLTLYPASFTRRLRYTLSAVLEQRTLPTDAKYWFGLHSTGSDLAGGGVGQSGLEFCFDTGVTNSWRVRSRLTPLGALVLGADTGIGVGVPWLAAIRYTQGAVPTVELLANDVVVQTFTGVAALPVPKLLPAFPNGGSGAGVFKSCIGGVGVVADGIMLTRQARFLIEELAA